MPVAALSVPATSAGVAAASAALDEFCGGAGVSAETRWRIHVALDELLSNVVRHGFQARAGTIDITFSRDDKSVSVQVVDDAPAFDSRRVAPPDTSLPLAARRPGGLGIVLVESLVDELLYERREGRNHVTLRKTDADQ